MLIVSFKPSFIKKLNKLDKGLQEEVLERIELFKKVENHRLLKVHKLHGQLSDCFSFSINYKVRIVFEYLSKSEVVLLYIGDHDIYK